MDVFRYLRSKIPASAHPDQKERAKEEFLDFRKTVQDGFPNKATCFDYDRELRLLAIGEKSGIIRVFGAPNVELVSEHGQESAERVAFVQSQGRIVSLDEAQNFHLYEISCQDQRGCLNHVKEAPTAGRLKKISCLCSYSNQDGVQFLIGTESGNVYSMSSKTLEICDYIIYQENVCQNIPEDYKLNPGAVEAVAVENSGAKLIVGYNRGLIVLWDITQCSVVTTFTAAHQVESLCWHDCGEKFVSSHNDGSYVVWEALGQNSPSSRVCRTPFGPFPCKAITKITLRAAECDDDFLFFVGGMPRASFADKNALTVCCGAKQTVFDFNSPIIDFLVTSVADDPGCPDALLVLCEEELVAIDLLSDGWPCWNLPYLNAFHASPVTACSFAPAVVAKVIIALISAGEAARQDASCQYSKRNWPINGGCCMTTVPPASAAATDLLITGHEDGTVKFWLASYPHMQCIYMLNCARLFKEYCEPEQGVGEEEWPPFHKVGVFDPFSDDARFTIQRLAMDSKDGTLCIGGTAGQTCIWKIADEESDAPIANTSVNIVGETACFEWKGHEQLHVRFDGVKFPAGYQPLTVLQILPPAAVTVVAFNTAWGVLLVGTAHGFVIFDYQRSMVICQRCLLSLSEVTSGIACTETSISRFKSFKKSLRESFRRRKHIKSTPKAVPPRNATEKERKRPGGAAVAVQERRAQPADDGLRPVERAVEARTEGQQLNSLVRCGLFCETTVEGGNCVNRSVWIGTQGGCVYVYLLSLPNASLLRAETRCFLAKEIRLRHGAPVLSMTVVDAQGVSVKQRDRWPDENVPVYPPADHHRVIICSEEQIKAFHLPSLKAAKYKCKLTAIEGMRIRKVQYVELSSRLQSDIPIAIEPFLVLMTNQGVLQVYDTRHLRRQLSVSCIPSQHVSGIFSTVLTPTGEGLYMLSGSQWQRFTVGYGGVSLNCTLVLPHTCDAAEDEQKTTNKDIGSAANGEDLNTTDTSESKSPSTNTTADSIRDFTKVTGGADGEEDSSEAREASISNEAHDTVQNMIQEITTTEECAAGTTEKRIVNIREQRTPPVITAQ